jgi:hypothetical protein
VSAKNEDKDRKWMWWFVGALVALQFYFVRELVVAFAMFTAVFAVITAIVAFGYAARMGWEFAVARMARSTAAVELTDAVNAKVR